MRSTRLSFVALTSAIAALSGGCGFFGSKSAAPLPADAFVNASPGADQRRVALSDEPGNLPQNPRTDVTRATANLQQLPPRDDKPSEAAPRAEGAAPNSALSVPAQPTPPLPPSIGQATGADVVREQVKPTISDTTRPAVATDSGFLTLGGVVASVDGTPVYANVVVRELLPLLSSRAKDLDRKQFEQLANREIRNQVEVMVRGEIEYKAASRNLNEQEKSIAHQLTEQWQQRQVTEAGGSLVRVRQKAKAEGRDFDEILDERFRTEMRIVYFQKRELPKIQITANDLRAYYDHNRDALFSERDSAKFRLIKIDPAKLGGMGPARQRIEEIRARAVAGEDFAMLAGTLNHDPALLKSKGDMGVMEKGAFRFEKIDEAVFKAKVGDVTPVIEDSGALYIAKIEERKVGRVQAFEEEAVQNQMRKKLQADQFNALREKAVKALRAEAIVYPEPYNYAPAVDMAMQQYEKWKK